MCGNLSLSAFKYASVIIISLQIVLVLVSENHFLSQRLYSHSMPFYFMGDPEYIEKPIQ